MTFPSSTVMSSFVTSATRRSRNEPAAVSTAFRPASSQDFSLTPTTSTSGRRLLPSLPPLTSSCYDPGRPRLRERRLHSRSDHLPMHLEDTSPETGSVTRNLRRGPRASRGCDRGSRSSSAVPRQSPPCCPIANQAEVALAGLNDGDRSHARESIAVDGSVRLEVVIVPPRLHPHAHDVVGCHGSPLPKASPGRRNLAKPPAPGADLDLPGDLAGMEGYTLGRVASRLTRHHRCQTKRAAELSPGRWDRKTLIAGARLQSRR